MPSAGTHDLCPEFRSITKYIVTYMHRVGDYIQQYSPQLGIYVFFDSAIEDTLNFSHFLLLIFDEKALVQLMRKIPLAGHELMSTCR